jgi:hypothetical protein
VSVQGSVPDPDFVGAIGRAHGRVSRLGIARARQNFAKHSDSGDTIRGLRSRIVGEGVEFYDRAPGGFFVEHGTRPHTIRPKRAKALRWVGPSGPIFAKKVEHPGTRAQPWLAPAIEDSADTLIGVYGDSVEREFSG